MVLTGVANSTDPNQKTGASGGMQAKTGLIREARLVAVAVIPVAAASVIDLTPWYAGSVKFLIGLLPEN